MVYGLSYHKEYALRRIDTAPIIVKLAMVVVAVIIMMVMNFLIWVFYGRKDE